MNFVKIATIASMGAVALAGGAGFIAVAQDGPVENPKAAIVAPALAKPGSVLKDCTGNLTRKPGEIVLTCADANQVVKDLKWGSWGADRAEATGTEVVNNCEPSCAQGHLVSKPVKVTLTDAKPFADRPEKFFTRIVVDGGQAGHEELPVASAVVE